MFVIHNSHQTASSKKIWSISHIKKKPSKDPQNKHTEHTTNISQMLVSEDIKNIIDPSTLTTRPETTQYLFQGFHDFSLQDFSAIKQELVENRSIQVSKERRE